MSLRTSALHADLLVVAQQTERIADLAKHFAGSSIERREQAQRAVALVLEAVTVGAPWRQRQHPVLAVEA